MLIPFRHLLGTSCAYQTIGAYIILQPPSLPPPLTPIFSSFRHVHPIPFYRPCLPARRH